MATAVAMMTQAVMVDMAFLDQKESFMDEEGYVCFLHGKALDLLWKQLALF